MPASLVALPLLVLLQSPAASPADGALAGRVLLAQQDDTQPPPQNPPLPSKPGAPPPDRVLLAPPVAIPEPSPSPAPAAPAATPATTATPAATAPAAAAPNGKRPAGKAAPRQLSLLAAEPLRGGSAALAEAGWSSLALQYGQGVTDVDDLGALLDLDWAKTELRLGAFWRRPLGTAGSFRMAGRLSLSWYADFGGTWIYGSNRHDRGFEATPALVFSTPGSGGIYSIVGEAPLAVTVYRGGGVLFSPRVSFAYEAPLYGEYTVGVHAGVGYRGGTGEAPLSSGRAELRFLIVGGWQL